MIDNEGQPNSQSYAWAGREAEDGRGGWSWGQMMGVLTGLGVKAVGQGSWRRGVTCNVRSGG